MLPGIAVSLFLHKEELELSSGASLAHRQSLI
jgi:hypothetical protein